MKAEIKKPVLVAAAFSSFCMGVSAADESLQCDYTDLAGSNERGEKTWEIYYTNPTKGPHLAENEILTIRHVESLPNSVDIFTVRTIEADNATFPIKPWIGRCVRETGTYENKYVLVGDAYLENGLYYRCRHQLVISRTEKTNAPYPSLIRIESSIIHDPNDKTCNEHRRLLDDNKEHPGHAEGGSDR